MPQLLFLLGYATDPRGWRERTAVRPRARPLPGDRLRLRAAGRGRLASGSLRGYVAVDERLPALRGRVRIADQLAAPHCRFLEITYDDYTADIPENRILAAGELLLRCRGRVPAAPTAAEDPRHIRGG